MSAGSGSVGHDQPGLIADASLRSIRDAKPQNSGPGYNPAPMASPPDLSPPPDAPPPDVVADTAQGPTADIPRDPPPVGRSTHASTHTTGTTAGSHQAAPRCLTVDVEDYYHIEAARGVIDRSAWNQMPSRVEQNTDKLIELLARHRVLATFFFLGDVAKRHPSLAPRVCEAGHEIATHGTHHDRLHRLTPGQFRNDLRESKNMLEDQTGQPVIGYRAPTFSLVDQTAWAIDVLVEAGIQYDASIFPVKHHRYGIPHAPDSPFFVRHGAMGSPLLEIPPLTWSPSWWPEKGRKLPVAGGGYFRLLPLWFMKRGLDQAARQNRPAVLYFHPWEFDPDTPRMPLSRLGRWRTYTGLGRSTRRLERIVQLPGRWSTVRAALDEMRSIAASRPTFSMEDHQA